FVSAWAERGDGGGFGGVSPSDDAGGVGDCGRGFATYSGLVPSEVSWVEVFVWVSGVSESGRSDEAVCAVEAGRECGGAVDDGISVGAGAVDVGDRGPSSGGEVFCGVGNQFSVVSSRFSVFGSQVSAQRISANVGPGGRSSAVNCSPFIARNADE